MGTADVAIRSWRTSPLHLKMGDEEDVKAQATIEECVRLLSSDSRERKFVGMLLVTRLIPDAADDAVLTKVYGATGFSSFVTSMLRAAPVEGPAGDTAGDTAGDNDTDEKAQQATASHCLALATCAALSKSNEVATDVSMVERLPLFAAAMGRKGRYLNLPSSAIADACEAVTNVIAAGGEVAAAIAADAGVIAASAAAAAAAAGSAGNTETDPDQALPLLGAMALLSMLLESPGACNNIIHGPEKNNDDDKKNQKTNKAVARVVPWLAKTFASSPGEPKQIEALRCLSLVLSALPARVPHGRLTGELIKVARPKTSKSSTETTAETPSWLDDLRGGVHSVLTAKAPRELRHVALDLCAAVCDLVGPRWLCVDALGVGVGGDDKVTDKESGNKTATPKKVVSFFRLVLELTRIETSVLLHDLTRDDFEVRRHARRMLHVPLVVYERLVGALAADVEAGEENEMNEGSIGSINSANQTGGSLLSSETASAAVGVLADVAGSLLEYLEICAENRITQEMTQETAQEPHESTTESTTNDPAVFLATTRALSSFLAELPEPHERRVNRLLPKLFSGGSNASEDKKNHSPLAPSPNARALVVRFLLPYLLQVTETPAGLDAFQDANGCEACGFLVKRIIESSRETLDKNIKNEMDNHEAFGVVAAGIAALRNAADGASKGLVSERLGELAGEVFWDMFPGLQDWAKRVTAGIDITSDSSDSSDDTVLRAMLRVSKMNLNVKSANWTKDATWRDALNAMEHIVPTGSDVGERRAVGGGGFLDVGGFTENESKGATGITEFEDAIEL